MNSLIKNNTNYKNLRRYCDLFLNYLLKNRKICKKKLVIYLELYQVELELVKGQLLGSQQSLEMQEEHQLLEGWQVLEFLIALKMEKFILMGKY